MQSNFIFKDINMSKYPETVYKDRVCKWFINSTRNMSDSELQKFVDLCMRGNLTFQCADEIDIDDPDISMIDHLLMDIASEKNDELINTYTDEIDWDDDYIEKYNKDINMDEKLEARIARLEKMARIKNESDESDEYDTDIAILLKEYVKAARTFSDAAEQIMYWTRHEYHQYNNDRSKKDYYLWEDIHDNSLLFIPDYSDNEDLISFVKKYI